jgi:hypothetical protein
MNRTMTRRLMLLALVAGAAGAIGFGQGPGQARLVFADVTVIGAAPRSHMMVIVGGDRIGSVEPYQVDRVPSGAQVIEARQVRHPGPVGHARSLVRSALPAAVHRERRR